MSIQTAYARHLVATPPYWNRFPGMRFLPRLTGTSAAIGAM